MTDSVENSPSTPKRDRQSAILKVIRRNRVSSQVDLRDLLAQEGIEVTQATLSRDLKELRLAKVPEADGGSHYTVPDEWENTPPLETLLPPLFLSAEGTGNLLVVKTLKGGAQAVAIGIDWEEWPEVLGTIAGDDTILLVIRKESQKEAVIERIEGIASRG